VQIVSVTLTLPLAAKSCGSLLAEEILTTCQEHYPKAQLLRWAVTKADVEQQFLQVEATISADEALKILPLVALS
jgi:hypothetical protein